MIRREYPRHVEGLRCHQPFPINAMEYQMINKFGLTDPHADFGDRQIGRRLFNADDLLLAR